VQLGFQWRCNEFGCPAGSLANMRRLRPDILRQIPHPCYRFHLGLDHNQDESFPVAGLDVARFAPADTWRRHRGQVSFLDGFAPVAKRVLPAVVDILIRPSPRWSFEDRWCRHDREAAHLPLRAIAGAEMNSAMWIWTIRRNCSGWRRRSSSFRAWRPDGEPLWRYLRLSARCRGGDLAGEGFQAC
jgi:hypothetical protein